MKLDNERRTALSLMLQSPPRKWEKAFGIDRPSLLAFWRWRRFSKGVEATKEAIRATLRHEFYPSEYIPRVELESREGVWHLTVHYWGNPTQ